MGLTLTGFNALLKSCMRLDAARKTEEAWSNMLAAQGRGEDMEKWLKRYRDVFDSDNDAEGEMRRFIGDVAKHA